MRPDIQKKLAGGDRRSIGKADEVVAEVLDDPTLFGEVIAGMTHDDPLVRMRSADVVEKVTLKHPEYLKPYKKMLIDRVSAVRQQEVRWHLAQIYPRLELTRKERNKVIAILLDFLEDESRIVKTFSMDALACFAREDASIKPDVIILIKGILKTGSPAMRSRGRKLLKELDKA